MAAGAVPAPCAQTRPSKDQHARQWRRSSPTRKERLGRDDVLPEGHLNRVEELHDEEDEEDAVEEGYELFGQRAREETRAEADGRGDEKEDRRRCEEHTETDVNQVFDGRECEGDSLSCGIGSAAAVMGSSKTCCGGDDTTGGGFLPLKWRWRPSRGLQGHRGPHPREVLVEATPSIFPRDSRQEFSPSVGAASPWGGRASSDLDFHAAAIHGDEARVVDDLFLQAPGTTLTLRDAREILRRRVHVHAASRERRAASAQERSVRSFGTTQTSEGTATSERSRERGAGGVLGPRQYQFGVRHPADVELLAEVDRQRPCPS